MNDIKTVSIVNRLTANRLSNRKGFFALILHKNVNNYSSNTHQEGNVEVKAT